MSRRERIRMFAQLGNEVELALMRQLAEKAIERAKANGLELSVVDESEGHYRLERSIGGRLMWSVDLWPTIGEWSRIAWRDGYVGPVLPLPRPWTILDAVESMITAVVSETTPRTITGLRRKRRG